MTDDNGEKIAEILTITLQTRESVNELCGTVLTRDDAFNLFQHNERQDNRLDAQEKRIDTNEFALLQLKLSLKPWHAIGILTVIALALLALVVYVG